MEGIYRGKSRGGVWYYGYLTIDSYNNYFIEKVTHNTLYTNEVDKSTIGKFTGYLDQNNKKIFEHDFTKLILPNKEERIFEVKIENIIRDVRNYEPFQNEFSKVSIIATVFEWNNLKLFPCIDKENIIDTEKMIVIGNKFDNSELNQNL